MHFSYDGKLISKTHSDELSRCRTRTVTANKSEELNDIKCRLDNGFSNKFMHQRFDLHVLRESGTNRQG